MRTRRRRNMARCRCGESLEPTAGDCAGTTRPWRRVSLSENVHAAELRGQAAAIRGGILSLFQFDAFDSIASRGGPRAAVGSIAGRAAGDTGSGGGDFAGAALPPTITARNPER